MLGCTENACFCFVVNSTLLDNVTSVPLGCLMVPVEQNSFQTFVCMLPCKQRVSDCFKGKRVKGCFVVVTFMCCRVQLAVCMIETTQCTFSR